MTEATPTERQRARTLFGQIIERSLALQATPEALTTRLWPFVSTDDETLLDLTIMLTALRDGAESRRLTRQEIVDKCNEMLNRMRINPKDDA